MSADDPVDEEAMVFTESDVYMLGGYLAREWEVDRHPREIAEDIERAVPVVLSHQNRRRTDG